MRSTLWLVLAASAAAIAVSAAPGTSLDARVRDAAPERHATARIEAHPAFGHLPLFLVENRGQTDSRVFAYAKGRGTTLFFTGSGVTYALVHGGRRWAVKADFVGAQADLRPELRDATPTIVSYFKGPREAWHTGLATFHEIVYRDVWPGIDAVWSANESRVECTYVVHPGADPGRIRLVYRGADRVTANSAGDLDIATPVASFSDERPVAYQESGGCRTAVDSAFALAPGCAPGERVCSFHVGAFDSTRTLVIDPTTIVYAGYIGPGGDEQGNGIAVDGAGNAYVTGSTSADETQFPVTAGPDVTYNFSTDAYVAKVKVDGTGLVWAGYIGGDDADIGYGIALDATRNVYVAGQTLSTTPSFPATVGPDVTPNGGNDAFIAKVAADGLSLVYAGFIGGTSNLDTAFGVAVDDTGAAYVGGTTSSAQDTFNVKVGPDLTGNGGLDGFVVKVKPDGTDFVYAGFIGGSGTDIARGIAVDHDHNAYVVGYTATSNGSFPAAIGPSTTFGGASDAFIVKVKADGTGFAYAGFIGGDGFDFGYGVAVDGTGRAYVTGLAGSSAATFPAVVGPSLTPAGGNDAFVARVSADGAGLDWCGYIGGNAADFAYGVALGATNDVYVTGGTVSTQTSFPVLDGPGLTFGGGHLDAFVAKVKSDGTTLLYAGFLGGSGDDDTGYGIAVDGADNAYVVGVTDSTESTFPVAAGPDVTYTGSGDAAFVVKIGVPTVAPPPPTPVESFLLPTKVTAKQNAAHPEKSVLTVTEIFDTGPGAVDLTQPATLVVGGFAPFVVPGLVAAKNHKSFSYAASGLSLKVTPSPTGSSRAAFKLVNTGDPTGKIALDGDLALRFTQGAVDGIGTVKLAGGKYALGKVRGALVAPTLFLSKASAALKGAGKDSLAMVVGFAGDGVTPGAAPALTVSFGGVFTTTVLATQFKLTGGKFVFHGAGPGITSAVLDYARDTITISGKALTLGTFADGPQPVSVSIGLGSDARTVRVRMVKKGTQIKY